jgi:hypothetical protein
MAEPMTLKKVTLHVEALRQLTPRRRSALLLVGLFLNEANWLRKLLVRAADTMSETPDGQANLSLTLMLATITAAKAHEGWNRLTAGELATTLAELPAREDIDEARTRSGALLGKGCISHLIRVGIAFHYPTSLDLNRLDQLSETESYVLFSSEGIGGHAMSHIATMAVFNELIGMSDGQTWQSQIKSTFDQIVEVASAYGDYVALSQAAIILAWVPEHSRLVQQVTIADAPPITPAPMVFFAHRPAEDEVLGNSAKVLASQPPAAG